MTEPARNSQFKKDDDPESPTEWVRQWKLGDQQAAQKLFDRYAAQLARLATSRLESEINQRVSGQDIVQSVFHSFFQRTADSRLNIGNSRDLWNLLVTMTIAKTRSAARHHRALKRTVDAEVAPQDDGVALHLEQGPGPAEVVMFIEQMELITRDLLPAHRDILAMRMAGYSRTEIAAKTGLSRQSIYRVLRLVESRISADDEL